MWAHRTKPLSFPNTISDEIPCGWSHGLIPATQVHPCTQTHTHSHTRTHIHAHTCTPYPKSPWLLKTPPPRPQWQLNGTMSEDNAVVSSRVSCSWERAQTPWGPCPVEKWGGRRLAPPASEKVSSCWTRRALVCRELNSIKNVELKASNFFNLAEIWFLSLISLCLYTFFNAPNNDSKTLRHSN